MIAIAYSCYNKLRYKEIYTKINIDMRLTYL